MDTKGLSVVKDVIELTLNDVVRKLHHVNTLIEANNLRYNAGCCDTGHIVRLDSINVHNNPGAALRLTIQLTPEDYEYPIYRSIDNLVSAIIKNV